jgi:L-asparaginase
MAIKILITGGTIDKMYNHLNGELIFTKSNLPEMLKQARCTLKVKMQTLLLKDSLDMNDDDREKILRACRNCTEDKIVITHGTDTMPETAKVLGKGIKNKTIVLLGAMIPYSFGNSDALFNLGCAISAVQCLQQGVYISMNGNIFSCDNVKKNKEKGEFCTLKKLSAC